MASSKSRGLVRKKEERMASLSLREGSMTRDLSSTRRQCEPPAWRAIAEGRIIVRDGTRDEFKALPEHFAPDSYASMAALPSMRRTKLRLRLCCIGGIRLFPGRALTCSSGLQATLRWRRYMEKDKSFFFFCLHDLVTGLPNRFLLNDRLNQAIASAERSGTLGCSRVYRSRTFQIRQRQSRPRRRRQSIEGSRKSFLACVRDGDTVARLGGDEFVVVLLRKRIHECARDHATRFELGHQPVCYRWQKHSYHLQRRLEFLPGERTRCRYAVEER